MLLQVVSIYDHKAEAYGTPNFVLANPVAVRGFTAEINRADPQNILYGHPDDFVLVHLGTFDDSSAVFTINPTGPKPLAQGREVAKRDD